MALNRSPSFRWCPSPPLRARGARPLSLALLLAAACGGCGRAPEEPDRPAGAEPAGPAVTPLAWEVPAAWTVLDAPKGGPQKAAYRLPKAGADKEDAECAAYFFGTGAKGDAEANLKDWFGQFDGDVAAMAKRETLEIRGTPVELVETQPASYKIALGPKVGPSKKAPVQMVKERWRMIAAVVKTKDRGNWFFKLTGPDETVQSAKSAFRGMLETIR